MDLTTSEALNAKGGDVRHTHDGLMLTIGNLAAEVYTVTDPDGATPTASAAITPYIGQGKLLSHMALQPVIITNTVPVKERVLGHKHYELADHLGNVRAVVSDMKHATWSGTAFEDYHAEVESRADYYAFGSLMPGRHAPGNGVDNGGYRFGFNGKEKDDEVHNAPGTSVDFGARMYDSRVGRWLSVDPEAKRYASVSAYISFLNDPIMYIDPTGGVVVIPNVADREPLLKMINSRARGTFAINDRGELYMVKPEGSEGYSEYYRDRLNLAIADEDILELSISETLHDKFFPEETLLDKEVDAEFGGGVTEREFKREVVGPKEDQHIKTTTRSVISGNPNTATEGADGKTYTAEPADILLHEIVGHAVPLMGHPDTGNAVENENKARKQLKPGNNQARKANASHVEF